METKKEQSRRKFIKTAGKAAVIAPAAGVILSAATMPELAQAASSNGIDPCSTQECQIPD